MNAGQDLTEGPIGGHLVRMTVPMFLGISSMIIASMIETIYIGLLGARELAAYSFTFPLIMGMSSLSMGIGNGAASIIARAAGSGDRERVRRFATHAMMLTILLVALLMVLGYFFLQATFELMGADGEILELVVSYSMIWLLGLPLFTVPMVANTVLRAVGNARTPGLIMASTSIVQVVVSPLLIFGLLGLPAFGMNGSAWAFVLLGVIRTVWMMQVFVSTEQLLQWRGLAEDVGRKTREIMYIAIPSMLNSMVPPVSMAVIIWLLSGHGDDVVAAFGITSRFEMLLTMILMSLSASIGPFVGQNFGAGEVDRIHRGLRIAHLFCLAWGALCAMMLVPFGDDLIAIVNDAPGLIEAATWYFLIVPVSFAFLGIGMMSGSTFVALGKPIPTTILALMRMIVVYLPLAMLLNAYYGYIGVFVATLLANVIMGVVAWAWSRRALNQSIAAMAA